MYYKLKAPTEEDPCTKTHPIETRHRKKKRNIEAYI